MRFKAQDTAKESVPVSFNFVRKVNLIAFHGKFHNDD